MKDLADRSLLADRIRRIAREQHLPAYLRTKEVSEALAARYLAGERGGFLGTLLEKDDAR